MNKTLRMATWACALAVIAGCSEPEQPRTAPVTQPVKVLTIGGEGARQQREFPGTVRATQRVTMAFQVSGRLVEFPMKEGQQVTQGEQLGLLDDSDYRSNVAAAQAELTRTEANFNRAKELIDKNYVSQAEYDSIQANYNIARSNLEKARKALNDTRLLAPFDGVVARTFVQNFEEVQAKEPVLNLQNNTELEVIVSVPENLVVRRSQAANLILEGTFEGIPGVVFPLRIKEFATEASADTQTFDYVLSIEQTEGHNLLPGMTAVVKALQQSSGDEILPITIPTSALSATPDNQSSVWLVGQDNRVTRKTVITGELMGNDIISVQSGLAVGDTIVIAGVSTLAEGMTIKPITKVEF